MAASLSHVPLPRPAIDGEPLAVNGNGHVEPVNDVRERVVVDNDIERMLLFLPTQGGNVVLIKHILAAGAALGPVIAVRLVRAIRYLLAHPREAGLRFEASLPAICAATKAAYGDIPQSLPCVCPLIPPALLSEARHWLGFARAAYCLTREAVLLTLNEHARAQGAGRGGAEPRVGGQGTAQGTAESTSARMRNITHNHFRDADLLHTVLSPAPLIQPHVIVRDRKRRAIVVSIRGTAAFADILADLAASPLPFAGGAAHTGMASLVDGLLHYKLPGGQVSGPQPVSAERRGGTMGALGYPQPLFPEPSQPDSFSCPIARAYAYAREAAFERVSRGLGPDEESSGAGDGTPSTASSGDGAATPEATELLRDQVFCSRIPALETRGLGGVAVLLQRALWANPGYRVVITGHSLGAGVAALLALKLVRILHFLRQEDSGPGLMAPHPDELPLPCALPSPLPHSAHAPSVPMVPPRPIHCWAYATPACMSPELAALSDLSAADIEMALMSTGQPPHTSGQVKQGLQVAVNEDGSREEEADGSWASLRRQPLVTSLIVGHDIVPRLTLASIRDLATEVEKLPSSVLLSSLPVDIMTSCLAVPTCGVLSAIQGIREAVRQLLGRQGSGAGTSRLDTAQGRAAALASYSVGAVKADVAREGGAVEDSDGYARHSLVLAPLEEVEKQEAIGAPAGPGAGETVVAQDTARRAIRATCACWEGFAARLRAACVPEPLVRALAVMIGPGWSLPGQELVVPGRIYQFHAQETEDQEAPQTAALYTVRRVPPSALARILVSPTMASDHATGSYTAALATRLCTSS